MSGRGNPPQPSPGRTLVSLLQDRPFVDGGGKLYPWAGQFLQRLIAYIGPINSAGSGSTLTDQVTAATSAVASANTSLNHGNGADGATQQRIAQLEDRQAQLPPAPWDLVADGGATFPLPGVLPPQDDVAPAPLPPPLVPTPFIVVIETTGAGTAGVYTASQSLADFRVGAPVILPATLADSFVDCATAPTASASGDILNGPTVVGTYTIAGGATAGSFSFAADAPFVASDFLVVTAPATPDATMTGLRFTILAQRA